MIKFFRKIRLNLLTESLPDKVANPQNNVGSGQVGKFSKYLLYAFGEIILVVIGILIALQININNEERKDRRKEKIILESLISDLESNQDLIKQGFADYNWKIDLSEKMANLFGKNNNETQVTASDSIIFWSAEYTEIELINSSIISLATSERLELLQNQSLKEQIVRYPTYIELYKEREDLVRSIVINDIRLNIGKYLSLQKYWNIPQSFESDYLGLFNDRELSNHYLNRLFQTQDAVSRLKNLNVANNSLIEALKIELEDRF
jgi:hypothetical protein